MSESAPPTRRRRRPHRRAEKRARAEAIAAGLEPPPLPAPPPRPRAETPRPPRPPREPRDAPPAPRVHIRPDQAAILGVDAWQVLRVASEREATIVVRLPDGTRTPVGRRDVVEHVAGACEGCRLAARDLDPPDPIPAPPPAPARRAPRARRPRQEAAPVIVRYVDPAVLGADPPAEEPSPEDVFAELLDLVHGDGMPLLDAMVRVATDHDLSTRDVERLVLPVVAREGAFDLLPLGGP